VWRRWSSDEHRGGVDGAPLFSLSCRQTVLVLGWGPAFARACSGTSPVGLALVAPAQGDNVLLAEGVPPGRGAEGRNGMAAWQQCVLSFAAWTAELMGLTSQRIQAVASWNQVYHVFSGCTWSFSVVRRPNQRKVQRRQRRRWQATAIEPPVTILCVPISVFRNVTDRGTK